MSDAVRDLLVRGMAAAKAGDKAEARFYLEWALRTGETTHDEEVRAWLWLSKVVDDPKEKRSCLESALAIDPFAPEARRELAILEGRLDPEKMVNPDALAVTAKEERLSLCPECGAPLFFAADGVAQLCERCGWRSGDGVSLGEEPETLLAQGIAAAKVKDYQEARQYLQAVAKGNAPDSLRVQAWFWLSGVCETAAERRACLEAVLRLDPDNGVAKRGLKFLEDQAPKEEALSTPPSGTPVSPSLQSRRFTCTQCGGKMAFEPGGNVLRCAYCGRKQSMLEAIQEGALVEEHDFTVALATAEGHVHPVGMQPFQCQGCQASFMLAPGVLSLSCPYCGSAHVLAAPEREVFLPEAILPFAVTEGDARQAFRRWLKDEGPDGAEPATDVRGLYLPVWTFDVGGALSWKCVVVERQYSSKVHVPKVGEYPLDYDDVLVAASHTLPADLMDTVDAFDTRAVVPYDPRYLADWPAEIAAISASDASLVARQKVANHARGKVTFHVESNEGVDSNVSDIQLNTSKIFIYAYKLILAPMWIARYRDDEQLYDVVINGQTGDVRGQKPASWLQKFVGGLLGQ